MSEERKTDEREKKNVDFVVEPLSDDELEDVSGGSAPEGCASGSGCCSGSTELAQE